MSESGHITWPSASNKVWELDYLLADSPDVEGIVVRNVRYNGRLLLYKGSLPSLRVQYDGNACGPYKDPLYYGDAQGTSRCPNSRVCVFTYASGGHQCLALESFYRIGSYRLIQYWVFVDDGRVLCRLYSAGLQCNVTHRHHVYWRFDFDIESSANDVGLEYNTYTGNVGWGPGWHLKNPEITRVKNPSSNRLWAVMDKGSGRGYFVLPGANDGVADAFSSHDIWFLRYHANEDEHGRRGSASNDDLAPLLNGENLDGQDIVVWYCAHLHHHAEDGGDDWHSAGPDLMPFNW
jgi:hypothetical protein